MFAKFRMDVRFLDEQAAKFKAIRDGVYKRVEAWAYAEGLEVLAFSDKIVPVDTGTLKSTGHVELPRTKKGVVTVEVGYGGPAVDYALKVHEDLDAYHDDGEPKYLEKGLLSREGRMLETLAGALSELYR